MRECEAYTQAETDALDEVLRTHSSNMERAGRCKARHDALVKLLKELERSK